jgi:hypothetical protein
MSKFADFEGMHTVFYVDGEWSYVKWFMTKNKILTMNMDSGDCHAAVGPFDSNPFVGLTYWDGMQQKHMSGVILGVNLCFIN